MEVEGLPSPEIIRRIVLSAEVSQPIVFRKIHNEWNPVKWDLNKFDEILSSKSQELSCRIGKINPKHQEPQWESATRIKLFSFSSIVNWRSQDEWIYFDYKDMRDVIPVEYLQNFEWGRLGFPERNGYVSNLWIGSTGCYTNCHFDTYGCNLVAQVKGRKKWILFPPDDTLSLKPTRIPYEESSVYSQINFSRPSPYAIQELSMLHGVTVTLEPGDVLWLPPKWWHYVQSEDFSISVNTWIEMDDDAQMRVEEGIVRSLVASFVSVCSPETSVKLLNPNEEELLDTTEVEIEKILSSAAKDFLKRQVLTEEVEPCAKKAKYFSSLATNLPDDVSSSSKLAEILEIESGCVKSMIPFDPLTFYAGQAISHDTSRVPSPSHIVQLINAMTHPDVIKVIRAKFLENLCSPSNQH